MTTNFVAVEAGGTKFVVGVGSAQAGSRATRRIETRDPDATFDEIAAFLAEHEPAEGYAGVGIATFGPVDLDQTSPTYGRILQTPKLAWRQVDLLQRMSRIVSAPVGLSTDVNAAALAEVRFGAGRGRSADLAYVTVGTGIGVGLILGGKLIHGVLHPEAGHILVRRHAALGDFGGICPSHGDCLEGIASGPAIEARWGASLDRLGFDHPAWTAQVEHLSQLCMTLLLTVAPGTIVLGGGVMSQDRLFPLIRVRAAELIQEYIRDTDAFSLIDRIVPPSCVEASGLVGAYLLAEQAQDTATKSCC